MTEARNARIAALRAMIEDEHISYREAGERLGMSRAAAIGLGKRARPPIASPHPPGWERINRARQPVNTAVVQEKARIARARALEQPAAFGQPSVDPTPLRPTAWQALEGSTPVEIEHHTAGCRWPIEDAGRTLFCNQPTEQGVYCPTHAAMAWRGDAPRVFKPKPEKERIFNGEYRA